MAKTNAIRILESKNISFSLHEYETDDEDLSGETVALKIGADVDEVFKTLVTQGDKTGINIFCIPVSAELDMKKAAQVSGNKKIEMVKTKDLFSLTGYIRGGCSPIGIKKKYPSFIDETSQIFDMIFVSAGIRGIQVRLSPGDLKVVTGASFADIIS
jgi:Cys-tRNA(Pro)/Cys-tRNA(Cys) deacylase